MRAIINTVDGLLHYVKFIYPVHPAILVIHKKIEKSVKPFQSLHLFRLISRNYFATRTLASRGTKATERNPKASFDQYPLSGISR